MTPRVRHPETHQPVPSIRQFDLLARASADKFPVEVKSIVTEETQTENALSIAQRMVDRTSADEVALYDPTRRVSEAAEDQGWKPLKPEDLPERPKKAKKIWPYTQGPIRGESEGEIPVRPDVNSRLSEETRYTGKVALEAARAEMQQARSEALRSGSQPAAVRKALEKAILREDLRKIHKNR